MGEVHSGYPRRDAEGRVQALGDLLGVSLAGLLTGVVALVVFDGVLALVGAGEFGGANGWLALILPGWLFLEEFRAWGFGAARAAAALVAVAVGITGGLLVAGLTDGLPPLASGALAAATCTLLYALIWFHGVRWLARRTG